MITLSDVISAISTVGFPIVSFLISAWFVKYTYDKQMQRDKDHDKVDAEHWSQLAALTQAVNENSKALRELVGVVDGKDKEQS